MQISYLTIVFLFLFTLSLQSQTTSTYSICVGENTRVSNIVSVEGNHFAVYYEADYKDYLDFFSIENGELQLKRSSSIAELSDWNFGDDGVWEVYGDVSVTKIEASINLTYLLYSGWWYDCDYGAEAPEVIEIDLLGNVLGVLTFAQADELIETTVVDNYELESTISPELFSYEVLQNGISLFDFESSLAFNGLKLLNDYLLLHGVEDNNAFFKVFDFEGNTNDNFEDLEIVSLSLEPIIIWNLGFDDYIYSIPKTLVEVRNNGNGIINSLQLKLDLANCTHGFCGPNYYVTEIENANLLPNQTSVFTFNEVEVKTRSFYGDCSNYTEHCVSIANPNKAIDVNLDNNLKCTNTVFTTTSVNELIVEKNNIFPSLFTNQLTIETETETQVDIWNISGKLVYTTTVISKQNINTQAWASGVYMVQFKNRSGIISNRKIIKN